MTFKPTAPGIYHFTVKVVNDKGCTENASETITVIDVRGGKKGNLVIICINGQTIAANKNAIPKQLNNGARLGSCESVQASNIKSFGIEGKSLTVYPNPAVGETNVSFQLVSGENYELAVYNVAGALIKTISSGIAPHEGNFVKKVNTAELRQGVYLIKLSSDYQAATLRLVVQP